MKNQQEKMLKAITEAVSFEMLPDNTFASCFKKYFGKYTPENLTERLLIAIDQLLLIGKDENTTAVITPAFTLNAIISSLNRITAGEMIYKETKLEMLSNREITEKFSYQFDYQVIIDVINYCSVGVYICLRGALSNEHCGEILSEAAMYLSGMEQCCKDCYTHYSHENNLKLCA
ncbi:MAG: hypothetical protein H3C64_07125 [Candidatus Kuenenia stuttgartiensis]|nr:hypothetical protein [Candidatus Kuenenia stuttgartiensis]